MARPPKDQTPEPMPETASEPMVEAAPHDAPASARPADTPAPPGPGRWQWNPESRTHTRLSEAR